MEYVLPYQTATESATWDLNWLRRLGRGVKLLLTLAVITFIILSGLLLFWMAYVMIAAKPQDWARVLADDTHRFTWAEHAAAQSWHTCAVGQAVQLGLAPKHPRTDPTLNRLGLAFSGAVGGNDVIKARGIYQEVMQYSATRWGVR